MKECIKCCTVKEFSEFHKDSKNKNGVVPACKECRASYRKEYYLKNKERENKNNAKWLSQNKEKHNEYYRKYYDNNKYKEIARSVHKRTRFLQRSVSWADQDKIRDFYKEAQRLTKEKSIAYHVDHIIPLQGKLVSGLHVETNLQVIPASENLSKSNKFNPNKTVKGGH